MKRHRRIVIYPPIPWGKLVGVLGLVFFGASIVALALFAIIEQPERAALHWDRDNAAAFGMEQ
jgi:hypothetical protein